jgi:hypothetical protein
MRNKTGSKTANSIFRLVLTLFMVLLTGLVLQADNDLQDKGGVRISWDEFRKLLELDKDEFVLNWQEFQILLRQTGFKYVPPYQLKDEKVVLTRDQFKRLLSQMKPPEDPLIKPPADYLLTEAVYTGRISAGSARFQAVYGVEVFDRPRTQFVKIPLFPVNIALKGAQLDGKPALVVLEGNRHTLTAAQVRGRHRITLDFALKTPLDQGPGAVSIPIPRTAVTLLEVDIPFKDIAVDITNAQELEVSERNSVTHVRAVLSPSNSLDIRWRKKPQDVEKGPAKVYSEILTLLSLEDDALRVTATVSLSILQNTVSVVTLRVPAGYNILNISGNGIEDWREVAEAATRHLEIQFQYPKKGGFTFSVVAEQLLPDSTMTVDFSGFAVMDTVREKGYVGVEIKSASEVTLAGSEGLDKLDVSELPASLINRSQKPLLFGFKYLRYPFSLVLDIQKHEELPVIGTVIDSASGVTLFTEDGKLVHRIIYQVRNTSKQFLELELPQKMQIWSVFVGGEPAKPRLSNGKVLIPLNRSSQGAAGLESFDVELIYFQRDQKFGPWGSKHSIFPVPDILISQMLWSVYLPEGYRFVSFGGTVDKEKTAQGFGLIVRRKSRPMGILAPEPHTPGEEDKEERYRREASKARDEFSANLALTEEQIIRQLENEENFSQRVKDMQSGKVPVGTGILPIRIQIPASGQLFRFAKSIVNQDPLTMNVTFLSESTMRMGWFIVILIFLLLLFVMRRRFKRLYLSLVKKIRPASTIQNKSE